MNRPELLLVDDDPIAIEVLSHMLSGFARLRFARTGAEALRLAREHCPDLMLLDEEMPGMSGLEVLQALQADATLSRLPVIVITSHRSADLEAEVFARGAVDFLPKPLSTPQVLSRVQAQLRLKRIALHAERMPPSFPPPKDASLLVVDDDIGAIQTLQSTLQALVGRIRFATNGAQALELMLEDPPDLVLLDVQMPGMDGFEVCRTMTADPVLRQIPIALLTRFSDVENEAKGLDAGATDFIAKPYQVPVLIARVRNLLRIKHENDQALRALSEHWQSLGAERVADIVTEASDAIVSLDAASRIVLINKAACRLFGVHREAVLGEHARAVLADAQALLDCATAVNAGNSGKPDPLLKLTPNDGVERLLEPSSFRIGSDESGVTTLLLHDVTAREKAREAELARSEAEAESRTKSMMLAYLAHEIGNPLNGILGFAQLIDSDPQHALHPVQQKRLTGLLAAGWHLQALLQDVMDLSRLEGGQFVVHTAPVDACKAAQAALAAATAQAELAQIQVELQQCPADTVVMADAGRLQQCLINLLSNAIKYNRKDGSVTLHVSVSEQTVQFAVVDSGLGMSPDQLTHLFEPFNRLGRSESKIHGTGIGLVVTRLLALAMGGSLDVASEQGKGSVFTLNLKRDI